MPGAPSPHHAVPPVQNPFGRPHIDLGGKWRIIVDPRAPSAHPPRPGRDIGGLTDGRRQESGLELVEFAFNDRVMLDTGRDWNTQDPRLFFYEGVVWYRRDFDAVKEAGRRYLLHFGAVNYRADVWLNGIFLGAHEGGFTPFAFDVTSALDAGPNFLIVKADAGLDAKTVPPLVTDWWNYGGIKREVLLLSLPHASIRDYTLRLDDLATRRVVADFRVEGAPAGSEIKLSLPELGETATASVDATGHARIAFVTRADLWSPASPKLYDVEIRNAGETIRDRIGFRSVERRGRDILLNGESIFLKGIATHEESPLHDGSAYGPDDARSALALARDLGANFVRLAHYPHNEFVTRLADEMGLLVWSEVPLYWQVDWTDGAALENARAQVRAMIERDRNRASVIIWSVANETPPTPERLHFLSTLIEDARALDGSRLVSAALYGRDRDLRQPLLLAIRARAVLDTSLPEVEKAPIRERLLADGADAEDSAALEELAKPPALVIDDPLAEHLDVVAFNEYFGWYTAAQWAGDVPLAEARVARIMLDLLPHLSISPASEKPFIVSEFGADAKAGYEGDAGAMMSESYQARLYESQFQMLANSPALRGLSPWVLKDFRSPLRTHPVYQEYYNRKGLVDETGRAKKVFALLQRLYGLTGKVDARSPFGVQNEGD